MTVTTTASSITYSGNGTTTAFAFPYIFFALTDLVVTLVDAITGDDITPPPVLNGLATYDYTVTGVLSDGEYASGGTVTFNTAPPAGNTVSIVRAVPAIQTVTLIDNTKFPAQTVNTEFDYLTVLAQDNAGAISVLTERVDIHDDEIDTIQDEVVLIWAEIDRIIRGDITAHAWFTDVIDHGADPTGVADSTVAFQSAVDTAAVQTVTLPNGSKQSHSWVYVPPGTYKVSSVTFPTFVGIFGNATTLMGPRSTCILHTDPTLPCFKLGGRNLVRGLYFAVDNLNLFAPIAGPPTISVVNTPGYTAVQDCQFSYSYIAIGSTATNTNNAWVIDNCSGFVHHRFVYIRKSLDISYVSNLHSHNPEGLAWDLTWYSAINKVLVEIDDCDGLTGGNWFNYAGRGVFKHSGTNNLIVTLQNITGENITHGIEIAAGSANGHHISIDGGYLQTNNRAAGVYLLSHEADVADLRVSNFLFSASANTDHVRVLGTGTTTLTGCTFLGTTGTTAIHKMTAGSRLIVDNTSMSSYATFFKFDAGCDNRFVYGSNNRIRHASGTLFSPVPAGFVDIAEPLLFEEGGGLAQPANIVRRTPSSNHLLYVAQSMIIHEVAANAAGNGGAIELSSTNVGGPHSLGSRARVKCYTTSGVVGGESSRMLLQTYNAGAYSPPVVIFEQGSLGYQAAMGAGGSVTQITSKATAVTLNKTTGMIIMDGASLAGGAAVAFTFANSLLFANDILHIKYSHNGTNGAYRVEAFEANGSAAIFVTNITGGALAEPIALKFYIFKVVVS